MDGGWALILSAVVTAVGGIIVTLISQFRKENQKDHDNVMSTLRIMHKGIGNLIAKLDKLIEGAKHGKQTKANTRK